MGERTLGVLDLFSGIGGFALGLEAAGLTTRAFCEIEPFCRQILNQHWPNVPVFPDIKELSHATLQQAGIEVQVICGGFPCQDISTSGRQAGLSGERSGLWSEFARLVEEIEPRWVIVENVSNLRALGLETVLADLASLGFDAQWHCIPAAAVGAPHRRDRVWILAHAQCIGRVESQILRPDSLSECEEWPSNAVHLPAQTLGRRYFGIPPYLRVGDAVSPGLDEIAGRLKALGNSIVPPIAQMLGEVIMTQERRL